MTRSTHIPADAGNPALNLYRADTHVEGLALRLGINSGVFDVGTWLSIPQARHLAAHLTAHADVYEAQFPVREAEWSKAFRGAAEWAEAQAPGGGL